MSGFFKWTARYWKVSLILCVILVLGGFALKSYYWPETIRVQIVSTDVKRGSNTVDSQTPDRYRVNYVPVINGVADPRNADVFENYDTWVYLKFNSGRLHASLNAMPRGTVLDVNVYGWRIPVFSMFKNITSFTIPE